MINIAEAMMDNPSYFKTLSVKDLLLVNYNCPQIERWTDLYTDLNHIIYTLDGERTITRPEKSIDVKKGSLIFLRKSAFQQGKFYDEAWQVIVFCIHDNYFQNFVKEFKSHLPSAATNYDNRKDLLFEIKTTNTIDAFFYSLLPYFTQQTAPKEALLELKMRELIFNILSNEANGELVAFFNSLATSRQSTFMDVLESNYMFNLSLEEFAKLTLMSLSSFKKEFEAIYKTSPGKWLLQKRLDLACHFLSGSDKPVMEVATESGFESVTHFNRVFKEKYTMTPSQYRNQ